MFNNLIESSSHRKEFKRRGSFFLFTTATYLMLFAITGVVSIFAYDARLEEQQSYEVTMLPPIDIAPTTTVATNPQPKPRANDNERSNVPERQVAMLSVNHPEVVPAGVSSKPNTNLSLPEHGPVQITGRDLDVGGPGGNNTAGGTRPVAPPTQIVTIGDAPPPVETPKPQPKIVSKGVITGLAISLPKPSYPALAKQMRVQGSVSVQVVVDETGKVISAKAISGSPFLTGEAQKAALQARFSPTILSDQAVKVSGVITYNFVMQ